MKLLFQDAGLGFVLVLLAAAPALPGQPAATNAPITAPRIAFSETNFNFGIAKSLDVLKHDFIVTNLGPALLLISNVVPSCGCTTAGEWDREITPGKTGKIPIEFKAGIFKGTVTKSVTVTCNDPAQPSTVLHIQATSYRSLEVTPERVTFLPVQGEDIPDTKVVRIINHEAQDLTLETPRSTNPSLQVELTTVRPGKEFELRIGCPGTAPSLRGEVTIKTSDANMPLITIPTGGVPLSALAVTPAQIHLPAGPLTRDYQFPLLVRNHSHTAVKLSAASVNAEGVTAQVQETETGKSFTVNVGVATNFMARPGEETALTVKTTHPKYPLIKVPIIQATATANAKPAAASESK